MMKERIDFIILQLVSVGVHQLLDFAENPRQELESHYYNPNHNRLFELGYRPTRDIDGELTNLLYDVRPYRERILEKQNDRSPTDIPLSRADLASGCQGSTAVPGASTPFTFTTARFAGKIFGSGTSSLHSPKLLELKKQMANPSFLGSQAFPP